jgi:polar amino acid transport system permease protein
MSANLPAESRTPSPNSATTIKPNSSNTTSRALLFPWWIVIILAALAIGLVYIFTNPAARALYTDAFWFILPGVGLTLLVTVCAYAIAIVVGLIVGLMRLSTNPVLFHLARVYVEIMRGLPLLVVVLYAGFVIGPWVRDVTRDLYNPPMLARAIVGLGLGYGAYVSEVFRSGIQSIGKGQSEAARSLGMSSGQTMRHVILPQAIRIILPPLGNDLVALLKDSSLIAVLALEDILQLGRQWISRTFRAIEGYNTIAFLYLVLTMTLSVIVAWIERRTRTGR